MKYIATLLGSPSATSRTGHLLQCAESILQSNGMPTRRLNLRNLPAEALVHARTDNASIIEAVHLVDRARAVIIATPVYNAAYSGLLKVFLDLLPRGIFLGKPTLGMSVGGTQGHMLALDYTLKPVLAALGSQFQLPGVFASELDMPKTDGRYSIEATVTDRLTQAVLSLSSSLEEPAAALA